MRVAVIGGGPSGLVTLKYLTTAHDHFPVETIETKLFESANNIGGVFLHHTYEDGEMVSSKFLTLFSDFRSRKDDPTFFSTARYLEYLTDYADHFSLWPHIHLSTAVTSVRRSNVNGHILTYKTSNGVETEWECDAIAVCSGLHEAPNIPKVPGDEDVPVVMHSEDFKGRKQFGENNGEGKTIMVLGAGETGFDICQLAMTAPTKRVLMCHRDGFWGLPKMLPTPVFFPWLNKEVPPLFNPVPTDVAHQSLFDTMYVHPYVRDTMVIWNFHDFLSTWMGAWLTTGSKIWAQYIGLLPERRRHLGKTVFAKSYDRILPYMNPKWAERDVGIIERIRRLFSTQPLPDAGRYIDVAPWPASFDRNGVVHFKKSDRPEYDELKDEIIKPDVLIYATGYTQTFSFLQDPVNKARPYPVAKEANVRNIWRRDEPTIGFIGYIRPSIGAIPSLAEMQAMLWVQNLLGRIAHPLLPEDEWHYRLLTPPEARVQWGVEHESYVYQLAKDTDGAPSILEVFKLGWNHGGDAWWKLPLAWCQASNINTKFRMRGPWAWNGAVSIMLDEIWGTVTMREGVFGHVFLGITPMVVLGLCSLLSFLYCAFIDVLCKFGLAEDWRSRKVMPDGTVIYCKPKAG